MDHRWLYRGSKHYRFNRGQMVASTGYVKIRVGRAHPLADPNGYAYEHLVVWCSAGNPRPAAGYELRHLNGDKLDSRIENLRLVSRAERNRLKNAAQLRDGTSGRYLSKLATRLVRSGVAAVRTVRRAK